MHCIFFAFRWMSVRKAIRMAKDDNHPLRAAAIPGARLAIRSAMRHTHEWGWNKGLRTGVFNGSPANAKVRVAVAKCNVQETQR
jgi:hypothetical protein